MSDPSPRTAGTSFPRAKIRKGVAAILPGGKKFELRVADSGIGGQKIVRVVTDAWKNLSNADRILKVLLAVKPMLTEAESDSILRFSVLTPAEYKEILGSRYSRSTRIS